MSALSEGRYLEALQIAGTSYNTFKNAPIKNLVKSEVVAGITNAVQQTPNRNINVITPIFGATPTVLGTAGTPVNATASPQQIGPNPNAGNRVP